MVPSSSPMGINGPRAFLTSRKHHLQPTFTSSTLNPLHTHQPHHPSPWYQPQRSLPCMIHYPNPAVTVSSPRRHLRPLQAQPRVSHLRHHRRHPCGHPGLRARRGPVLRARQLRQLQPRCKRQSWPRRAEPRAATGFSQPQCHAVPRERASKASPFGTGPSVWFFLNVDTCAPVIRQLNIPLLSPGYTLDSRDRALSRYNKSATISALLFLSIRIR